MTVDRLLRSCGRPPMERMRCPAVRRRDVSVTRNAMNGPGLASPGSARAGGILRSGSRHEGAGAPRALARTACQPSQSYNGFTQRRNGGSLEALSGRSPMAEPAGTPLKVAAREQDVLLATKLHMPRTQPGFVPRQRLLGALNAEQVRGVVLVCAPAGFGKTALLADWARRSPRPVAWLSLDAGDNDPARFWRHATAALDEIRSGIAERVGPLIGPPAPPSFEGLVTALINELASQPGEDEVLLVLD